MGWWKRRCIGAGENLRVCVSSGTDGMIFLGVGDVGVKNHFFAKVVRLEFVQNRPQPAWQLGLRLFCRP